MYKHTKLILSSILLIIVFSLCSTMLILSIQNNPDVIGLILLVFFIFFPLIGLIGSVIIGRIPYVFKFLYPFLVTLCAVLANFVISRDHAFISYPFVILFSFIPSFIALIVTALTYRKKHK